MGTSYVAGKALCILVQWDSPTNTGLGPANSAEPLTQFRLRVSGQAQEAALPPNQTSSLVCGLVAGTSYTFSVAAGNVAGLGPYGSVSQTAIGNTHPRPPRAPPVPPSLLPSLPPSVPPRTVRWRR
jgi:hypothetical protein